jgi:mannose-6-phosphate isomerase
MTMGTVMKDQRPWGSYTVLEEQPTYKVKRLEVLPGQRLSYQKHEKRSEHWVIVAGRAIVTLEGKDVDLSPGQSIDIPRGAPHRIANPGIDLLTIIEIQNGDYFGEDDIIRLEDDYGRVEERSNPAGGNRSKGDRGRGTMLKRGRR